ncbi:hypothetical protein [Salinirubrum litoreum]|uniref:Uncharacterized protein n=1 Tax=Salinirubrum litoreum TaxID=1126234 RepID=A0ABD5R8V6_9EURY|nr:hypothetical protein [Salinirubrum litoreum]
MKRTKVSESVSLARREGGGVGGAENPAEAGEDEVRCSVVAVRVRFLA